MKFQTAMKPAANHCLQICLLTALLLGARSQAAFMEFSGDWQDTANWADGIIDGMINNSGTAIFDPNTYKTGTTATMPEGGIITVGGVVKGPDASILKIVSGTFGNSAITLSSNIGNRQAVFEVSGGTVVFGDVGLAEFSEGNVTWTQTGGSTTFGEGEGRTYLAQGGGKNVMSFSGDSKFTINTTGDQFAKDIVNSDGSDLTITFSGKSSFTTLGPPDYGIKTDRQSTSKSLWHFAGSGVTTSIHNMWEAYAGTTFQFTADKGGVSPVHITFTGENWNRLDLNGSPSLQVDVAAYKPVADLVLFTYPKLMGMFGTVTITHGDRTLAPFTGTFTSAEKLPEGEYYLDYGPEEIILYYNARPPKGVGSKFR